MRLVPPAANPGPDAALPYRDALDGVYPGSRIPAEFFNSTVSELTGLITKGGMAPASGDLEQVARAVRSQRMNWLTVGGTANDVTLAPSPAFASLADLVGVPLRFLTGGAANTAAMTLVVSGLAAKAVTWPDGSALAAGALPAGVVAEVIYDGAAFRMSTPVAAFTAMLIHSVTAGSPTVPSGVTTTLTATSAIREALRAGSSMAAGIFTVGAADAGLWHISGFVELNVTGYQEVIVVHNATATVAAGSGNGGGAGGIYGACGFSGAVVLAAGDTLRLQVSQTSGGNASPTIGRLAFLRIGA